MSATNLPPIWQCIAICWGTKFTAKNVTDLFEQVLEHASVPPRLILLTDQNREDIPSHIEQRVIDPFYLQPKFLARGAQAKLSQFAEGTLPCDIPTVCLDLDTLVIGDVYRVVGALRDTNQILMLGNSLFVFSRAARFMAKISGGRFRSRGNSSVLCYLPSKNYQIDIAFREEFLGITQVPQSAMGADDRFISWLEHHRVRRLSSRIAVKFPAEYMRKQYWHVALRARLPWVKRRRASLAIVTFPGADADIDILRQLPEQASLRDDKGRMINWTDKAAYPVKQKLMKKTKST
jgi:hypothetical protein